MQVLNLERDYPGVILCLGMTPSNPFLRGHTSTEWQEADGSRCKRGWQIITPQQMQCRGS